MSGDLRDRMRRRLGPAARFLLRSEHRREVLHDWQRSWRGAPPLPFPPLERVLVLCHGNICRSPFAAALLRARCRRVEVRSAGLAAGLGSPADPTAIAVARDWSIDLADHRASPLMPDDLSWAHLVLVMTAAQIGEVLEFGAAPGRTRLLGDYLGTPPFAIADPFGCTADVFRTCFGRIEEAIRELSEQLGVAS